MTRTNDPLVGTTYDGRYRVEKRIGAGGMANVYCAQDETLGRRVAIKVLHQRYAEDSQFTERFTREASAAARLNHPNIVQVYDRGSSEGTWYIAMELVDGMTLKDLIRRRGGLTEQEVLAYGRQALHALRFAHRNGIVHRDVKPHNMMVDTDGRLKIADFGIARAGADSGLTEAGSIVGTAQYLSPEQAQGHEVAAPSDLYSLGVVMFEMATGRVPFDGDQPVNVALKHVKDPAPHPSDLNPEISPAIESIILKAMEKDPARRYSSADEMLADLDRAREGGTTQAMTQVMAGAAAGATRVTRLEPLTPAASTAYEPVGRYVPLAPAPAGPEEDPWDADQKKRPWRWLLPLLLVFALIGALAYFALRGADGEPVPDVVGLRERAARTAITDAGFRVGEVDRASSADEAEGVVIGQDPEGAAEAEPGDTIDLVVSSGPERVDVPDVVGDKRADAIAELQAEGFKVTPKLVPDESVPPGRVISQSPRGGAPAPPGSAVTINVSQGPEKTEVPRVVGESVESATSILEQAGFEVDTQEANSSEPHGTVLSQQPEGGSQAKDGATVLLTLASGKNEVPDVSNTDRDDAIDQLNKAGFSAQQGDEVPTSDQSLDGRIEGTDPQAGSLEDVGSTIEMRIYRFEASGDDGGGPPGGDSGNGNGNGQGGE